MWATMDVKNRDQDPLGIRKAIQAESIGFLVQAKTPLRASLSELQAMIAALAAITSIGTPIVSSKNAVVSTEMRNPNTTSRTEVTGYGRGCSGPEIAWDVAFVIQDHGRPVALSRNSPNLLRAFKSWFSTWLQSIS